MGWVVISLHCHLDDDYEFTSEWQSFVASSCATIIGAIGVYASNAFVFIVFIVLKINQIRNNELAQKS